MLLRPAGLITLALILTVEAFGSATPLGSIPVGDSPFALALSSDNSQAVVVNLFPTRLPDGTTGPNIRLLDVVNRRQVNAFQLGTRLVAVALSGTSALVVNEDQDVLRVVDVASGRELGQIVVGSRPSNVVTTGPTTAIVMNGTSGDLSFIDVAARRVVSTLSNVGKDPRGGAIHPAGRYAYIALGGDNAVAVVDLGVAPARVIGTVPVGKNPVSVAVTPDGARAVVANLTSNTVTVLNLGNPASPAVVMSVPVGVQPTALAVNPRNPNIVYIANLASQFFSVLDLSKTDSKSALIGVVQMGTSGSGIRVSSDATRLLVTEFQNAASLRIYDLGNMPLDPTPTIDVPGEPRLNTFLDASGVCSFYIAEASLAPGQKEGFWGMEVLVSKGLLTGGFNLGGGFEGNGQLPGFGAFSLASPQHVTINVAAQQLPGTTGSVVLNVDLKSGDTRVTGASGPAPLTFSADLQPGFYVITITTAAGSPRGTFQMGLSADAFSGGVVVGGFITQGVTGFGAFCVPTAQNVSMHLLGNNEYGSNGSGDLILTVRDAQRNILRTVNNSVAPAAPPSPPDPPSLTGINPTLFVSAAAATGGDGSRARPLRSITSALARAKSGDIISVAAGRYSRTLTGETIPLNTFPAGVTVLGAGAATTTIDGENVANNAVVIAQPNVRVAGLTFRGAGQVGLYVFNANNVTIDHNFFTSNGRFGVGSQGSRGLIVTNNVALANQESGMAFSGATGLTISNAPTNCQASPSGPYGIYIVNNTSNDNRADGILLSQGGNVCVANNVTRDNGSSGIEFNNRQDTPSPALNGVIANNEITGNGGVQFGFAGTGILITETANADIIQGNKLSSNRPFGIGIFLNGKAGVISNNTVGDTQQQGILVQRNSTATEISSNTVTNSGLSGLFVDTSATVTRILSNTVTGNGTGLKIVGGSSVTTVDQNTFDSSSQNPGLPDANGVGLELSSGTAGTISNNTMNNNDGGGAVVIVNSAVTSFNNNKARNNRGLGGLWVDNASTANVTSSDLSNNASTGISLLSSSRITVQNSTINSNQAQGVAIGGGSSATISGTTVNANQLHGVLASDPGSAITMSGGNSVTNTQGFGVAAQTGATITCSGTNSLSGNTSGNVFGAVTGCQ